MAQYHQLFQEGDRQQQLADAMLQKAMQPRGPQQTGRIASQMHWGEGLAQLGEALLARRQGKKASATTAQAEEQRRQAQAAALAGMASGQSQNPYASAQEALESGVDPTVAQSYLKQQAPDPSKSPFGVVDPSDFTPASLAKFSETGKWSDLVPVEKSTFNRVNPRDYTPESLAKYVESGNLGDLVRVAPYQFKDDPAGGVMALDPISGQAGPPVVTPERGTEMAASRASAVAQATTTGEARGGLKSVRLEAAQRRLARVREASEALSVGGPVVGQVAGAFPAGQELNQANAQLMTELTALTRVPGVGSQSDLEQRLAQLQLPTPEMYPEVRANAIAELEAFMADLDKALSSVEPAAEGGDINSLLDKYAPTAR